jgi:hypothetical protein
MHGFSETAAECCAESTIGRDPAEVLVDGGDGCSCTVPFVVRVIARTCTVMGWSVTEARSWSQRLLGKA